VVHSGPRWVTVGNDIFGNIDLIAKKQEERTRWIQVTSAGSIGRKRAELQATPWDKTHDSVEIWRWVGGQARRHASQGVWLDRQYFQVYHLDDDFALRPDRRMTLDPAS
jgi:hypothetical protein